MKKENKLEQVILYFLSKCKDITKDKLECLLYFADFDFFERYGKPLFKNVRWIKGKKHPSLQLKVN